MNNRQAGRRRGRGGQRQGGNPGRPESGNRIDNRARGNAAQLLEKYKNLAADAQRSGDRINTEYYLQFADHYFRVLSESRSRFEDQQPQRRGRDDEDDGDDDYGMEGEPGSPADEDPRAMPEAMTPPAPPPQPQSPPPQQQAPVARPAPRVEADGDEDGGEVRAEPRRRGRPRREAAATAAAPAGEERLDASVLPPAIPAQEPAPRRTRTRRPREADDGVVPA